MKFRFLTAKFFEDYKNCPEMEKKQDRPYANVCLIELDNLVFAIPIRSNIKHKYAIYSNKEKTKGLDLTKAVIINDLQKYIDNTKNAYINLKELEILRDNKHILNEKLLNYIEIYKKAVKKQDIARNKILCSMSCLQYFHKELKIDDNN